MCDTATGAETLDVDALFTARPRGKTFGKLTPGLLEMFGLWNEPYDHADAERGVYPRLPVL